jgi:pimeloyl-ACP methyl ester carboxylesterase
LNPVTDDSKQLASLKACLKSLPGDPRFYTTPIAMEDLDQVRSVLGYEKIDLYGVSYGTRAALVYLRQYPQHVRTVILDGVAPLDWLIGPTVAQDAQRAMEIMVKRCEQQSACQSTFPNLEKSFKDLLARLDKTPQAVEIPDPITGKAVSMTLDDKMVANALRLLTYVPESASILPLLIHNAAEHGDLKGLAAQYLMVNSSLYRSLADGMYLSVLCSEDAPFFPNEQLKDSNLYFPDQLQTIKDSCLAWTRGDIPANYHEPVKSDVPVLLLSGEADPITPPANADQAARTLPNSLKLVATGQGHNVIFRGCFPRITRDFIEKGSVQGLDTGCIQTIQPAPFFTSLTGPTP